MLGGSEGRRTSGEGVCQIIGGWQPSVGGWGRARLVRQNYRELGRSGGPSIGVKRVIDCSLQTTFASHQVAEETNIHPKPPRARRWRKWLKWTGLVLLALLVLVAVFHKTIIFEGTRYFVVRAAKQQNLDLDYRIEARSFQICG